MERRPRVGERPRFGRRFFTVCFFGVVVRRETPRDDDRPLLERRAAVGLLERRRRRLGLVSPATRGGAVSRRRRHHPWSPPGSDPSDGLSFVHATWQEYGALEPRRGAARGDVQRVEREEREALDERDGAIAHHDQERREGEEREPAIASDGRAAELDGRAALVVVVVVVWRRRWRRVVLDNTTCGTVRGPVVVARSRSSRARGERDEREDEAKVDDARAEDEVEADADPALDDLDGRKKHLEAARREREDGRAGDVIADARRRAERRDRGERARLEDEAHPRDEDDDRHDVHRRRTASTEHAVRPPRGARAGAFDIVERRVGRW
mmetsp:Transcript_16204/g.65475  ORF Transcript_16204/g.65475 Transcript_16204/m.65475 type:complete len:325 (+) Transcript_16204:1080-2054(+)